MRILVLVSFILGFSILLPSFPTVPSTSRALTLLPNAPLLTLKGCGGSGWLCVSWEWFAGKHSSIYAKIVPIALEPWPCFITESRNHEWFRWKGTLKLSSFHPLGHLSLDHGAQSPVQPGLEHSFLPP